MNASILRNELTNRVNNLGYFEMLQLRSYLDSYAPVTDESTATPKRREPGALTGTLWMSEDFDETPDCFADYQ